MHILHLANHTYRHNGNVHAAIDLACGQSSLGHRVTVCSVGGHFDDLLRAHGVQVVVMPDLDKPAALGAAVIRLHNLIRQQDVSILHAHMMKSAVLGWAASRLTRARLVTTVHNAFEPSAILMALGDRVIAVSSAVGASMRQRGVPARRLRVVLNGTVGSPRQSWNEAAPQRLQRPAALYVGGLHPRKGVADLLAGFATARETRPDLHLYVVGEGPCGPEYRQLAGPQGDSHVHFCGAHADPRPFMRAADVFVLASHADPAPLVISEAREAGLAIIATDVDGIPELLDGGAAGRLIPPHAPDDLARALLEVFHDDASLARQRAASRHNLERLSLRRVAEETLAVYAEIVRPRADARPQAAYPVPKSVVREDA